MTGSETARAVLFVSLAILGCLIRTYIRTANGEKEDEVHFWSSRFSQLAEAQPSPPPAAPVGQVRPRSTTTSSGEVSQAVSVLHDQPPRFAPFLADTVEPQPPSRCSWHRWRARAPKSTRRMRTGRPCTMLGAPCPRMPRRASTSCGSAGSCKRPWECMRSRTSNR